MNRRDLLKTALLLPFASLIKLGKPKDKVIASLELKFENGDRQVIYVSRITSDEKSFVAKENSMGHAACSIVTEFDIGPGFYVDSKPIVTYTGYDAQGNVCYSGLAVEKIWRSHT